MAERRDQLRSEVTHWHLAVEALADLDTVAAPAAWQALESYLQQELRSRLRSIVDALRAEAVALERLSVNGGDPERVRAGLLRLRRRYLRVETLLDFFGDAVNSRTNPALAELLRGYDVIASDSMSAVLTPLGLPTPPTLTYQDKGLGASILRAGIRLWDGSNPSPVAAIKLTRHNLSFPTSLLHETGHQALALSGYRDELEHLLRTSLTNRVGPAVAALVSSWASELGADVHAVHHAGWAPVVALANVVDGSTPQVLLIREGDPHPPALVRTVFNARLCHRWLGAGPWDDLESTWRARHPIQSTGSTGEITTAALDAIDDIVEICSATPMRAFRGRSFSDVLDPRRVSPDALDALGADAGESLLSSTYLQRREPVRILALLATRGITHPDRAAHHRSVLVDWVRAVGRGAGPAAGGIAA